MCMVMFVFVFVPACVPFQEVPMDIFMYSDVYMRIFASLKKEKKGST